MEGNKEEEVPLVSVEMQVTRERSRGEMVGSPGLWLR